MFRVIWVVICCGMIWLAFLLTQNIYGQVNNWYDAKHWEQTNATVSYLNLNKTTSTERDSNGRSYQSTHYHLTVQYHYQVSNKQYIGKRVSFSNSEDSDEYGYNNQMFRRLNQAKTKGDLIPVWYNPREPESAVIDRDITFNSIITYLVLLFFFGGTGLSGLYFQIKTFFNKEDDVSAGKALTYPILILLLTFCLLSFLLAISSFISGDYKGLVALVFPAMILPIWIESRRHFRKKKKNKEKRLAKPGVKEIPGIQGRVQYYASKIYLGVFIFLIGAPLSFIEITSFSEYSVVSYLIFSVTALSFLLFLNAILVAITHTKFGDIYLVTNPDKIILNKNISAKIKGFGLSRPNKSSLTMIYIETDRYTGASASKQLLREDIALNYVEISPTQKFFEFDFLLPENLPIHQKKIKVRLNSFFI